MLRDTMATRYVTDPINVCYVSLDNLMAAKSLD